jgi:hypothetical protein
VIETESVLTALRNTTYLGSHPRAKRRVLDVDIVFTRHGLSMRRGRRREFGEIPWASIIELSAAAWDTEERRISWPSVLLVGWLWAVLTMRRTTYSYLTVTDAEGEWAFAVPGLSADELRSGVQALQQYVIAPSTLG